MTILDTHSAMSGSNDYAPSINLGNPYALYPYGLYAATGILPFNATGVAPAQPNPLRQAVEQDTSSLSGYGQLMSALSAFTAALYTVLQAANLPNVSVLNSHSAVVQANGLPGLSSNTYQVRV